MNADDFEAHLAALREDYLRSLPPKLAHLAGLWSQLAQGWDPRLHAELHRAVHSLTGSGRTFGIPALSEAARALEMALASLAATRQPPGAAALAAIGPLLRALERSAGPPGAA